MNDCCSGAIDEIGDEGNMAAPAKRIDGIDFWRGLALLMIFIDHVPENVFQHVTQKNFGFSDAAELFVFLSGVSVALAYGTRFFEGETAVAVRAVLRRAFTLSLGANPDLVADHSHLRRCCCPMERRRSPGRCRPGGL